MTQNLKKEMSAVVKEDASSSVGEGAKRLECFRSREKLKLFPYNNQQKINGYCISLTSLLTTYLLIYFIRGGKCVVFRRQQDDYHV